ncbi:hypothetical protein LINGRAHAP2_LOCUS6288 [Linum grandiflorum]
MAVSLSIVTEAATALSNEQGLGFGIGNVVLPRLRFLSINNSIVSDSSADQLAYCRQSSAIIVDVVAPPPVKPDRFRTARRTLTRKRRRTRRRSSTDGDSGDFGGEYGVFGGDDGGNGPFGFGGGGGGGWGFDRFGEQNWDESSSSWWSASGFAYGFIYEVIYWIALSNCVHFAFNKVAKIMASRIGDGGNSAKVRIRLASISVY